MKAPLTVGTTDAQHLIRVRAICEAADVHANSYGKGLRDTVIALIRPDARTPQWIEARLRKEAEKLGYLPYGVTFSGFLESQWELTFTPAQEREHA